MKRLFWVISLLFILSSAQADVLIVKKDGSTILATTAKKDGDAVGYTEKRSKQDGKVALTDLDGVLPKAKRGKKYDSAYIKKNISKAKSLIYKHKKLRRELTTILQEWEAYEKPVEGMDEDIVAWKTKYDAGKKGTTSYKNTIVGLDMLKYKDFAGKYKDQIDTVIEEVRLDYLKVNQERAKTQAKNHDMSISRFIALRVLVDDMLRATKDAEKKALADFMAATRKTVFDSRSSYARTQILSNKSIKGYIESNRVYNGILDQIADTEEQKKQIHKELGMLKNLAKKSCGGYSFDFNGYPLSSQDKETFMKYKWQSSTNASVYAKAEEECLMFPRERVGNIKMRNAFSQPMRLIFRYNQPDERQYGFQITLPGIEGREKHVIPIKNLKLKDAAIDIALNEDFSAMSSAFELNMGKYNRAYMQVQLVYEKTNSSEKKEWVPLTHICYWRIHP